MKEYKRILKRRRINSKYNYSCGTRIGETWFNIFELKHKPVTIYSYFLFFFISLPFYLTLCFISLHPSSSSIAWSLWYQNCFVSLLILSLFFLFFPRSLLFFSLNLLWHTLLSSFTLYSYSLMVLNKQEEVVYRK